MAQDCHSTATAMVALLQIRLAKHNVQVNMQPANVGDGEVCPSVLVRFKGTDAVLHIRHFGETGWMLAHAEKALELPIGDPFSNLLTALDECQVSVADSFRESRSTEHLPATP